MNFPVEAVPSLATTQLLYKITLSTFKNFKVIFKINKVMYNMITNCKITYNMIAYNRIIDNGITNIITNLGINQSLQSNMYSLTFFIFIFYNICYFCTGSQTSCGFKSAESYIGILYPEYAVVIPGALESHYLKSLIFRGFRFNCNLLSLIERTPCI